MATPIPVEFPTLSTKLLRELGVCEDGLKDYRRVFRGRTRFKPTRADLRLALDEDLSVIRLIIKLCMRSRLPWAANEATGAFLAERRRIEKDWRARYARLLKSYADALTDVIDDVAIGRDDALSVNARPDFEFPLAAMEANHDRIEKLARRLRASRSRFVTPRLERAIGRLADALGLE